MIGAVSQNQTIKFNSKVSLESNANTGYAGINYTVPANSYLEITGISDTNSTPMSVRWSASAFSFTDIASSPNGVFFAGGLKIPAGAIIQIPGSAFRNSLIVGTLFTNSP